MGTTGAQADVSERHAREPGTISAGSNPRCRKPSDSASGEGEHAEEVVSGGADGVIVGCAFIDIIAEGVEDGRGTSRS